MQIVVNVAREVVYVISEVIRVPSDHAPHNS